MLSRVRLRLKCILLEALSSSDTATYATVAIAFAIVLTGTGFYLFLNGVTAVPSPAARLFHSVVLHHIVLALVAVMTPIMMTLISIAIYQRVHVGLESPAEWAKLAETTEVILSKHSALAKTRSGAVILLPRAMWLQHLPIWKKGEAAISVKTVHPWFPI